MTKQPLVEVGAVVLHYGNVLLVRRDDRATAGRWSIPSCRLKWGESLQQCIEREVKESTGISIAPGAVIHVYDQMLPESEGEEAEHRVVIELEARYVGGELALGENMIDVAWASGMALSSMDADKNTIDLLTELGFFHDN